MTSSTQRYRLAAYSDDLHTDFAAAARLAAELGLDAVGVRNVWGRSISQLDEAEVRLVKRTADDHGLAVSVVGSPYGRGFYIDADDAQREAEALLARMIRCADILQTPLIRVFALWLPGQEPLAEWPRRPRYPDCLDQLVERLTPSLRLAERAGVTMMFEVEGASYMGQVAEARQIIERLDSRAVALCWDVSNGWWSGEKPWPDGFQLAEGLPIVDVQTKDVYADSQDPTRASLERAIVGEGDLPYDRILPALIQSGYAGYITAERVHHPGKPEEDLTLQRQTLADIENLKRILAGVEVPRRARAAGETSSMGGKR
jgi:sugar phosphate isomerase/epimerase